MKNSKSRFDKPQQDLFMESGNDLEVQSKIDEILKQAVKEKKEGKRK